MSYLLVMVVGLLAGMVSGVVGTGSSIMLMPFLVVCFGPQQAVPIMAIGAVMGNLGKLAAWWPLINWRAAGSYAATAVPGAILGVHTLLTLPAHFIDMALGLFFIAMVPTRRALMRSTFTFTLAHLALVGFPVGFLTGIVVSTGPITVPVFMSYGLAGGAFLATEAAGSLAVYGTKIASFSGFGALPRSVALQGVIVGGALMAGTFWSRTLVLRMPASTFSALVDAMMLMSGASMLWAAAR